MNNAPKVGDRVRVIDIKYSIGTYKMGDLATITRIDPAGTNYAFPELSVEITEAEDTFFVEWDDQSLNGEDGINFLYAEEFEVVP